MTGRSDGDLETNRHREALGIMPRDKGPDSWVWSHGPLVTAPDGPPILRRGTVWVCRGVPHRRSTCVRNERCCPYPVLACYLYMCT